MCNKLPYRSSLPVVLRRPSTKASSDKLHAAHVLSHGSSCFISNYTCFFETLGSFLVSFQLFFYLSHYLSHHNLSGRHGFPISFAISRKATSILSNHPINGSCNWMDTRIFAPIASIPPNILLKKGPQQYRRIFEQP